MLKMKFLSTLSILVLMFFQPLVGRSQSIIDSLNERLYDAKDTIKVQIYIKLAYEHALVDNEQALIYIDSAMRNSKSLDYAEGKMQSYLFLGKNSWKRDLDSAIYFYTEALEISESLRHNETTAQLLNEIGNCHLTQGNLAVATRYFIQCRMICEKINNKKGLAIALVNLGVISRRLGSYSEAEEYFGLSLAIAKEIGFDAMVAFNMNQRAIMLSDKGSFNEAISLHQDALQIFTTLNDNLSAARSLASLGSCYSSLGDFRKAIDYYWQCIAIYEKLGIGNKYDVYLNLANAYRILGNYDEATQQIKRSWQISSKTKNKKGLADTGRLQGQVLFSQGNYSQALGKFIESHKIYEELKDPNGIADALINIGQIYEAQNDIGKALLYYNNVLKLNFQSIHPSQKATALQAIGKIHLKNNNLDAAAENFNQALSIRKAMGDQLNIVNLRTDLGEVYFLRGKFQEALTEFMFAKNTMEQEGYKSNEAHTLILLSKIYMKLNNNENAIHNLRKALATALQQGNIVDSREASEMLTKIYAKRSEFNQAYTYMELSSRLKDSLYSIEKEKVIRKIQSTFELQQQLKENEILKRDNLIYEKDLKRQYILSIAEGIGFVLMIIVSALLFRGNKNKKTIERQRDEILTINKELSIRNEELDELNKEKNRYMGMIAHDLRSPLNHVKGLVNLFQISSHELNSEQQRYLELINESIQRQLAMITRILDGDAIDSHQLNISIGEVNLTRTVYSVLETFAHVAEQKQIILTANITQTPCMVEADEGYLTQILENLVSNALKFSPSKKKISIQLKEENGVIVTEIKDQGPGISVADMKKMFKPYTRLSAKPTAGEKSTGLGLSIVKKYIEAMNGSVWCKSKLDEGTSFFIALRKLDLISTQQRNSA